MHLIPQLKNEYQPGNIELGNNDLTVGHQTGNATIHYNS